jgi:hypothetical protein
VAIKDPIVYLHFKKSCHLLRHWLFVRPETSAAIAAQSLPSCVRAESSSFYPCVQPSERCWDPRHWDVADNKSFRRKRGFSLVVRILHNDSVDSTHAGAQTRGIDSIYGDANHIFFQSLNAFCVHSCFEVGRLHPSSLSSSSCSNFLPPTCVGRKSA